MMKRITLLFACAALAMAGCSKEENGGLAVSGDQELRLAAGIEAATRAEMQSTAISRDETVWAWVSDAETGESLYQAVKLAAGAGGTLSGETMYFPQTGNGVDIRALHGSFAEELTAFPASIGFTVATGQSAADTTAYIASDLLYAAADDVARTKSPVPLKFYHMLSKLELRIVQGAGVTDEITGATLDGVAVAGTFTPVAVADMTQAERAGMISAGEQTGTMTLGTALSTAANNESNDAIVVPQEVGGKTMTFTLKSGGTLVYTLPEGKSFESGKRHIYTVTLKGTGLSVESSIEPWAETRPMEGEATMD